jgi:hypothetical protein
MVSKSEHPLTGWGAWPLLDEPFAPVLRDHHYLYSAAVRKHCAIRTEPAPWNPSASTSEYRLIRQQLNSESARIEGGLDLQKYLFEIREQVTASHVTFRSRIPSHH